MSDIMDIYSQPGTPVTYVNFESGWPDDKEFGAKHLERNRTYHVKRITVYSSVSFVELVEIPGKQFNTVLFR